ncbi:MaoC/PaaZ C-terminal domain-containing protein, partial [Escherichia coli]|nr:MaoC/PaaZ C-terminal domain-containing protein [Escherichia coli]
MSKQWVRGAKVEEDRIHPFRKYFEELQPGDSLLTPRRTMTEADIVNFACLSGDHFYAHMDKIAAAESIFGGRMSDEPSYSPPVDIGGVMVGGTVSRVVESNHPYDQPGDCVLGYS